MKKTIVALLMACAVVISTSAQQKANPLKASADKALTYYLKDIKVDDAQKTQLEKLTLVRETSLSAAYKDKEATSEDRKAKVNEINSVYTDAVVKIIGNNQMEQWNANMKEYSVIKSTESLAIRKMKVMLEGIEVTPDQKAQVVDLAKKYELDRRNVEKSAEMDAAAKKSALSKVKNDYYNNVISIIGESQKAQWMTNDKTLVEMMKNKQFK